MNGLTKIWNSAKGMLVIITLTLCTIVALLGKMSIPFATCITGLVSVMLYVHGKNNQVAMQTGLETSTSTTVAVSTQQGMSQGPPPPTP
jgi:hypothetical protein